MTGTYIQSLDIPENELNQKLKTNQLIYFYNLSPKLSQCFIFGLLQASFFTCKTTEH